MVSYIYKYPKDPDAVLDYKMDWAGLGWLGDGESIASYTVTVDGVTLDSTEAANGQIVAWVSGGTAGETATIAFRITTDSTPPRTDERTVQIRIRQR